MELSKRLTSVAAMVNNCEAIADIGTDHGYIPIFLLKNNIIKRAIATDINIGPLQRAKSNVMFEDLQKKIEFRLGGGLSVIKPKEVNSAVISGMGGYLIKDIIESSLDVFRSLDYLILQPVQNPEVVREYIYNKGFKIIEEDLCFEDNKFYEIIKVAFDQRTETIGEIKETFFEIGEDIFRKKHPILKEFIEYKIEKYKNIYTSISEGSNSGENKKKEILRKIKKLEELSKCL